MTISTIKYDLQAGFIHNWLTAGPQSIMVQDLEQYHGKDFKAQIAKKNFMAKSGITKTPVERGPLTERLFKIGAYEGSWSYTRCAEDHCIDQSVTFSLCHFVRSWAYTQILSPTAQSVRFNIFTAGPVDVWVNNQHIFHGEQFSDRLISQSFEVELNSGDNEILVRFETVAALDGKLVLALQIEPPDGLKVNIPSLIPSIDRRNELEKIYEAIYLDREVYCAEELILLNWPGGEEKPAYVDVDFKDASGLIQGRAEDVGKPNDQVFLGNPLSLLEGQCRAIVMPRAWEYYELQIRITKELTAYLAGHSHFSDGPYGTLEERCAEALSYAARLEDNLFAEIAKMALAQWNSVDAQVLTKSLEKVNQRQGDSILIVVGLLGMLNRFGKQPEFPQWVKKPIKECLLNYRYWQDEPGSDLMDFAAEDQQILFHTGEILAGQLYPDQIFTNGGLTGKQHRQKGERLAQEWMHTHGINGFSNWDSNAVYANTIIALTHLIDLSRSEPIWGYASVLLDKIFFTLALNSHKGVFGSSQGHARTFGIKSGVLEATSGVTRVMWGMGTFNLQTAGSVSVALLTKYELPPILADIAAGLPAELWNHEQQGSEGLSVNKVTYRTPDAMLSSAQDYKPGQPGTAEHIWQATLGPKSVVFTNHPACRSEKEERGPNFWRGNGILPRVAQWKDALIAIYHLPTNEDLSLDYTHAYFPEIEFDEVVLRDGWAMARKGDGYIALTASNPLIEIQTGPTARRELRAYGKQTIWVCQLGRTTQDGDFSSFQEKVLTGAISFDGLSVNWQTLRGDQLSFGWEAPFLRNGDNLILRDYKHFENPYTTVDLPCKQMEIKTDEYVLRLDFDPQS